MSQIVSERDGERRRRRVVLAAAEGALAGIVAAVVLVGAETIVNRWVQQEMLFLPLQRLGLLTGPLAVAGALASTFAAVTLRPLRRLRRAAVLGGIALLGLIGIGLGVVAVFAWRKLLFPPATPGSIGAGTAALVALPLVSIGGLLLARRGADALETDPARKASGGLQPVAIAGGASLAVALALFAAVPQLAAWRAAGRPSVVMISIDTLRADRLGALGYERPLTPNLDRLADGGAVFLQAAATSPWTLPSHGSLFTSMLPFDHGGRWFAAPVPPRRSMLAERFRDAGYRTAAFTGGGWMEGDRGFYQGFGLYREFDELAAGSDPLWQAAAGWIARQGETPCFLFVHTYEVHTPYLRGEFADPSDAGRVGPTFDIDELSELRSGRWSPTPAERRYIIDLYDGDVAAADRRLGAFLERLETSGRPDDLIVVVLSDHGEDLWDHEPTRSADHGHSLYEELLRIPLIVRYPGRIAAGVRVAMPVSLLDVAPTVLALAGLPADPQHRGKALIETLRDGVEPPGRPLYAESVEYGPDRFSARLGDLKVIVTPFPQIVHAGVRLEVEPLEIFDLRADPGERRALESWPDELAERLSAELLRRGLAKLAAEGPPDDARPDLPERLRALGYLQ